MELNYSWALDILQNRDNFYILSHQSPDGDTMGSGFALVHYLRSMGKKANLLCSDPFPPRYAFMSGEYTPWDFPCETVVAVDVADQHLLGAKLEEYKDRVDLCIDHHISNTRYAKHTLMNPKASATCEVLFEVFTKMERPLDLYTATCLYTGMATDTGCFKFENTSPAAHRAAAQLMELGVEYAKINRRMFDVKSKERIRMEQALLAEMQYFCEDKLTLVTLTRTMMDSTGLEDSEFEGLASLPMQLDGVEVGLTLKEREDGAWKVSMRSAGDVNVSALAGQFGGGGHIRAAGCLVRGELSEVRERLVEATGKVIQELQ